MPLEATMFCLDNSDWMRNGDYNPTRLAAQNEAVQKLASANLRDNVESTTGFLTMAASKVDVHLSPCKNMGKMLNGLKSLTPSGKCDIVTALKVAQLTLKNRQNKSQRQRIILFVGSPVSSTTEELTNAGRQLKKNGVAVDVVLFGTEATTGDNPEKLEALVAAVNNADNSHLVAVPPGPHRLSDMVMCSSIAIGGARAQPGVVGTAAPATFDELDSLMETDPELALALRMSLEEAGVPSSAPAAAPATPAPATTTSSSSSSSAAAPVTPAPVMGDFDDDDEEAQLAAAIALSLQMEQDEQTAAESAVTATPAPAPAPAPTAAAPAAPVKAEAKKDDKEKEGGRDLSAMMDAESGQGENDDLLAELLAQVSAGELDEADIAEIVANLQGTQEDKDKQDKEKK